MKMKAINEIKIILTGGGTGGHLYPALAIAEEFQHQGGQQILFVGTKRGIESRVVPEYGYAFKSVWIAGWKRGKWLANILVPFKLFVSFFQALQIHIQYRPDMVIGTGGYVCWPLLFTAVLLGKKTALQEQNAYPGVVTRVLSRYVNRVYLSFESSTRFFKRRNHLLFCGNPTRGNMAVENVKDARNNFQITTKDRVLFVFGGSQGAKAINEFVLSNIQTFMDDKTVKLIWVTGPRWAESIRSQISKYGDRILLYPYLKEMHLAYHACDLILCRAGATTIAEITRIGIPVIFIPFAASAGGHQKENAKAMVDSGAAVMVEEKNLGRINLANEIVDLIKDKKKLNHMRKECSRLGKPDSAKKIVQDVNKIVNSVQ